MEYALILFCMTLILCYLLFTIVIFPIRHGKIYKICPNDVLCNVHGDQNSCVHWKLGIQCNQTTKMHCGLKNHEEFNMEQ